MFDVDLNEKIKNLIDSSFQQFIIGKYTDSINDLKAALVLDKENPVILYNLGINYCRLGLFKTAAQYYQKLLDLPFSFIDSLTVKKLYSYALIKSGSYAEAENILNQILTMHAEDVQVQQMLAYGYEKTNQLGKAVDLYKAIIEKDPECYSAFNSLAYTLALSNKDLKTALAYAKKALSGKHKNPAVLDTIGFILLKLGDYKRAEKFLYEANTLFPFHNEIEAHIRQLKEFKDSATKFNNE